MTTVLVVDDEKNYLWMLEEILRGEGYDVVTCEKGSDATTVLQEATIDVLLTDLRMAEMDGLMILDKTRELSGVTSPIVMTAYGTVERAVEAMKRGAYDFLVKPFERADLIRAIQRAAERSMLARENSRLSRSITGLHRLDNLVARSPAMAPVLDKIKRVSDSKTAVLISGESGVGKELVARAIHFNGPRRIRPFLAVNCGALTDTLAESELFGHERGAFTGAHSKHVGLFEQADGGTLFLDEIGELPLTLQSKLLRVLDNQEIRRVGSEKTHRIDVRIVSATNRDLKSEIQQDRFREDLFFRLAGVRIDVPPLRERTEDILLLAEAHLQRLAKEGTVRGKEFSPQAQELLVRHRWPGNVRELHNVVAHAALMAQEAAISEEDLPIELATRNDWISALDRILPMEAALESTLEAIEQHLISRALTRAQGIQARAADLLKISRSLLQYKLRQRKEQR
jgi:two-component system NtrC family response regulator